MNMNMKIVLLTLLVIFATVTVFASTVVTPNIPASGQSVELGNSSYNVYDEAKPLGKDKGGGWG